MSTALLLPGALVGVTGSEQQFADVELLTGTYVVRTACHGRAVYISERQLPVDRTVTAGCPVCGVVRVLVIPGPVAIWGEAVEW